MDNLTGEITNLKEYYKAIIKHDIDNKIFCFCVYEFKDTLKELGFTWNSHYRLWNIEKEKFTKDLLEKCLKVRYKNNNNYYYYVYFQNRDNIEQAKIKTDAYEAEKEKANPNYKRKTVQTERKIVNRNLFITV